MIACPRCNKDLPSEAKFCDACGYGISGGAPQYRPEYSQYSPYPAYAPLPLRSSGIAVVLAVLLPGLGHFYLGKLAEGIAYMILFFVMLALFWLIIPLVIAFVIWIWQIFDAHIKANQYNAALTQTGRAPW